MRPAGDILASLGVCAACCLLPLALLSVGVAGAWVITTDALAPYKWVLIALTAALLDYGFYAVYFRPKSRCAVRNAKRASLAGHAAVPQSRIGLATQSARCKSRGRTCSYNARLHPQPRQSTVPPGHRFEQQRQGRQPPEPQTHRSAPPRHCCRNPYKNFARIVSPEEPTWQYSVAHPNPSP